MGSARFCEKSSGSGWVRVPGGFWKVPEGGFWKELVAGAFGAVAFSEKPFFKASLDWMLGGRHASSQFRSFSNLRGPLKATGLCRKRKSDSLPVLRFSSRVTLVVLIHCPRQWFMALRMCNLMSQICPHVYRTQVCPLRSASKSFASVTASNGQTADYLPPTEHGSFFFVLRFLRCGCGRCHRSTHSKGAPFAILRILWPPLLRLS